MTNIRNVASFSGGLIDLNRAQVEHRATWLAYMYDEALKEGVDAHNMTRNAVRRCGFFHGEFYQNSSSSVDFEKFNKQFFHPVAMKTFEMDSVQVTDNELTVEFHYCPLVTAWQKIGVDDETCAVLCDIAMEGDRAIAEAIGARLEITDTIAKGCNSCKMKFIKA
jgi:predicted ArsR family transcriptional regulator